MTEIFASHLPLLLEEGANASGGVPGAYFEQKVWFISKLWRKIWISTTQIIDPGTLIPCKQGHRGEVLVRGAPQTIGYLNKPEAGKSLFDDEGWVHTGLDSIILDWPCKIKRFRWYRVHQWTRFSLHCWPHEGTDKSELHEANRIGKLEIAMNFPFVFFRFSLQK